MGSLPKPFDDLRVPTRADDADAQARAVDAERVSSFIARGHYSSPSSLMMCPIRSRLVSRYRALLGVDGI